MQSLNARAVHQLRGSTPRRHLAETTSLRAVAPRRSAQQIVASQKGTKGTIAVFGATGGTGAECVYQALAKGYSVSTLVRDPARLITPPGSGGLAAGTPMKHPHLKITQGNVTRKEDVAATITDDCVGVVVALGGRPNDVGETMLRDGTTNVIEAMKAKGVKRVAIVTSIGAGSSADQAPFAFKVLMFTVMRSIFADKNDQENLFLSPSGPGHDLEWTVVRPGGLGLGPPAAEVRIIKGEAGSIARSDVATFCLAAVLDKDFPYLRTAPAISTKGGGSDAGELWVPSAESSAARR